MAAFRKVFLALAVVAAVMSTAPSVFAQPAVFCTAGPTLPVVRVEGLTEYIGDIFITCTGGNPTAKGVTVLADNFELDISGTTFTSRLLDTSLPEVNGGYPYVESLLIINEAFPKGSANPNNVPPPTVPTAQWSITQKGCPQSDQMGFCQNVGNGKGGWGTDGTDATSSYGKANSGYNVYQGYQYSSKALRFDDIPVDPPGTGVVLVCNLPTDLAPICANDTPEISFRITNVRIDATGGPGYPYVAATPLPPPISTGGYGPGYYATLTVTGSQPVSFSNLSSSPVSNTNLEVAVPEHALKQVVVSTVNSLICQDCSFRRDDETAGLVTGNIDPNIYHHQTFSYYAQENFASVFAAQTYFYNNVSNYEKLDPHSVTGSGPAHTKSTQDIAGYSYFSASNFYPDGDTDLPQSGSGAGLIDPQETGQATNGLRIIFAIGSSTAGNDLVPGVNITAPAVGCIYGGKNPTGQSTIDHHPCSPADSSVPVVGGLNASGVAILLGAVTPNGGVDTDYGGPNSFYSFVPVDVTVSDVALANEPIQFVYEVMYADGTNIETLWVPFDVDWCNLAVAPLPPPITTAYVGMGPISDGTHTASGLPNNLPSNWVSGEGDYEFPRFVWGIGGNPLPPQQVWYLDNCNCDLLFPYVVSTDGFDTGFAISNTSADPYGTNRSDGYVQFFYYLNSLSSVASSYTTLASAPCTAGSIYCDGFGRNLLGNDGVLAAGPASNVGPHGGTYTVYQGSVYDPANGINARSSFQQITFNPVPAGDQFIALLSTGAWVNGQRDQGWGGTPEFQGYIFAVSGFPYCHGYAFVSSYTLNEAQGYLALVIDEGNKLQRAANYDFVTGYGVLTTDPSWSYSHGVVTGGIPYPTLNPRDTNKNEYNN